VDRPTRRETEFLLLFVQGLHTKAIAAGMDIEPSTARRIKQNPKRRLDFANDIQLVLFAQRNGLIRHG